MNTSVAWLVVTAVLAQSPDFQAPVSQDPPPSEIPEAALPDSPPSTVQPDPQTPGAEPAPRKKKRRRKARVRSEEVQQAPQPTRAPKAPRRMVTRLPRPPWNDFHVRSKPLTVGARSWLAASQSLCALVGVGATLATAGGAALLARTVDRPAGGLLHVPVPLGGMLPLGVGMAASGATTFLCVEGLGWMAERRPWALSGAMGGWLIPAFLASAVGTAAIFFPVQTMTTRGRAIRENTVAASVAGLAIMGPVAALGIYHALSVAQEKVDARDFEAELAAAKAAEEQDAARAARPPPTAPVPEESPAAPDPQPTDNPPPPASSDGPTAEPLP